MKKIKEDMIKKATTLHEMNIERIENIRKTINASEDDKSIMLLRQREDKNYNRFVEDVNRYNFLWNGVRDTTLGIFYKATYNRISPNEIMVRIYSYGDLDIFDWKLKAEYGGLELDYYECQKATVNSNSIWWDLVYNAWHKACEHDWLIWERKFNKIKDIEYKENK